MFGMHFVHAAPQAYQSPPEWVQEAERNVSRYGGSVTVTDDVAGAVALRRRDLHRPLVVGGPGGRDPRAPRGLHARLPGDAGPHGQGAGPLHLHALPAGVPQRRGHRLGHRLAAVGRVRPGREPAPRGEGDPRLAHVPAHRARLRRPQGLPPRPGRVVPGDCRTGIAGTRTRHRRRSPHDHPGHHPPDERTRTGVRRPSAAASWACGTRRSSRCRRSSSSTRSPPPRRSACRRSAGGCSRSSSS